MLDMFRKRGVMSVVYSVLLGAVIIVFVIQFRPNSNGPVTGLTQKCVAKVRGTCIDERDWRAQRYLIRGQYDVPSVNWNKAAVDSLVERTLLEQEAKRLGVRVTEDEVMHELVRWRVHVTVPILLRPQMRQLGVNPDGVRWTQFGTKEKPFEQATFEKVVQATTGQNVTEFVDTQQQELVAARMLSFVAEHVKVSDVEAFEQFQHERSTTTLSYVKFDPKFFTDHFVTLDRDAVTKWAAEHKAEVDARAGTLPKEQEKRLFKPRHILIEAKKDAPADQKAAAKKKADDLLAQVKKGGDFAALAKANSTDPGSKDKGGEYEWTAGYEYVPEFRDGLAKLKVGETTVVETQYGYHVLQLQERFDGDAAVAFPLYREARGGELAQQAAQKVNDAMKGKLPIVVDAALKTKVEDLKKSGKSEADATAQVVADETKARVQKAIDEVLAELAPKAAPAKPVAPPAPGAKPEEAKPVAPASWTTADNKPRVDESTPFSVGSMPIPGIDDPTPIFDIVSKLTPQAPLGGPAKVGNDHYLVILKDRHAATREEFEKDKNTYVGILLAKKRDDAQVNYLSALRDGLGKGDLVVEQRYLEGEKKGAPGEAVPPQQMPFDEQ